MAWLVSCGVCGHKILADSKTAFIQACLHFQSSHAKHFNGCVFSNSHEFVSLEYHKQRREVVFFVAKVSRKTYESLKLAHSVNPFPKTRVY